MTRSVGARSDEGNSLMGDRKIIERPAQPTLRRFHGRRIWWVLGALALMTLSVVGLKVYPHLKSFVSTYLVSGGTTAHYQAYAVIYNILRQQAALLSYIDMFRILVIVCLVCIPAVLLFRKPQGHSVPAVRR